MGSFVVSGVLMALVAECFLTLVLLNWVLPCGKKQDDRLN